MSILKKPLTTLLDGISLVISDGVEFSPINYEPRLWSDAADSDCISFSSSNSISTIMDKSGNSRDFTQVSGSKQPSYVYNEINNENIIRFDGVDDIMTQNPFIYDLGSYTMFFVFKASAQGINLARPLVEANTGDNVPQVAFLADVNGDTEPWNIFYRRDNNSAVIEETCGDIFTEKTRLLTITDTGSQVNRYIDGYLVDTINYTRGTTTLDNLAIGGLKRTSEGFFANMDFCELLVYGCVLDSSAQQAVEGHLIDKWYEDADVVSFIGQSNADGRGDVTSVTSYISSFYTSTYPELNILYKPATRSGGKVVASSFTSNSQMYALGIDHDDAAQRTHQVIGGQSSEVSIQTDIYMGAELAYGYEHYQNFPNKNLYIFKAAVGGGSIEDDWGATDSSATKMWEWFKGHVYNPGIKAVLADGKKPVLDLVWWMQGEN